MCVGFYLWPHSHNPSKSTLLVSVPLLPGSPDFQLHQSCQEPTSGSQHISTSKRLTSWFLITSFNSFPHGFPWFLTAHEVDNILHLGAHSHQGLPTQHRRLGHRHALGVLQRARHSATPIFAGPGDGATTLGRNQKLQRTH